MVLTGKDGLPVKKFFAFLLMFAMLFSVGFTTVGCGSKEKEKDKKEEKKKDEKPKGGT